MFGGRGTYRWLQVHWLEYNKNEFLGEVLEEELNVGKQNKMQRGFNTDHVKLSWYLPWM